MDPERQTVEYLQERLIREEIRLDIKGNTANALAVTKQSGSRNKCDAKGIGKKKTRQSKQDVECYRCQERGHYASECPQKKQNQDNRKNEQSSGNCAFVLATSEKGVKIEKDNLQSSKCDIYCRSVQKMCGLPTVARRYT